MYAHFDRDETGTESIENLDREELIRTVVALRNDVYSIASDIHEVIKKNDLLEKEVQRLRSRRTEEPQRNKAQQVKQEIDNLVSLFDAASTRRAHSTRANENRFSENRFSENRFSENRFSENRFSENRFSENRFSENRIPEDRADHSYSPWMKKMMMMMMIADMF